MKAKISKRIDKLRGDELDVDEAEDEVEKLERFAKKLEPNVSTMFLILAVLAYFCTY